MPTTLRTPHRFFAAAQNAGITRTQAQTSSIDGDVGPRLKDDDHHTNRHGDLLHAHALSDSAVFQHLAHRVGQIGDGAQILHHTSETLGVQGQTIEHGRRQPVATTLFQIHGVGRDDVGFSGKNAVGGST